MTTSQTSVLLGISIQVHGILHDYSRLSKVSACWIPKLVGSKGKLNRSDMFSQLQELLARYGDELWQQTDDYRLALGAVLLLQLTHVAPLYIV
ncbi:hypothetical protein Trydic_g4297 [Trypoxylus dichotomus]